MLSTLSTSARLVYCSLQVGLLTEDVIKYVVHPLLLISSHLDHKSAVFNAATPSDFTSYLPHSLIQPKKCLYFQMSYLKCFCSLLLAESHCFLNLPLKALCLCRLNAIHLFIIGQNTLTEALVGWLSSVSRAALLDIQGLV